MLYSDTEAEGATSADTAIAGRREPVVTPCSLGVRNKGGVGQQLGCSRWPLRDSCRWCDVAEILGWAALPTVPRSKLPASSSLDRRSFQHLGRLTTLPAL